MFDAFILGGAVTLVAIAVLVFEILTLLVLAKSRGIWPMAGLVANAISGLFLILALRAALLGIGAVAVASFLGLAFAAHIAGVATHLRQKKR